jgi:hypothetical protein
MRFVRIVSAALLAAASVTSPRADAQTVIAPDPAGKDSAAAIEKALRRAKPGETILLRGGVYGGAKVRATIHGAPGAPVTIRAFPKEMPVLDGTGVKMDLYDTLFELTKSSHVVVDGLEVRNAAGRGINLHECAAVTVRNCSIHDVQCRALGGSGEKLLFEGNKVWNACLVNADNAFVKAGKKGGWPATVQTSMRDDKRASTDVVFRNNEVRDSWGEGIDAWFLDGGAIEGNTVRDCYSVLIYTDTARNLRIDRNVCVVANDRFYRADLKSPPAGIHFATERYDFEVPSLPDENIVVSNNLVIGTGHGISFWCDAGNTKPYNTYRNILVAHNVVKDVWWDPVGFDKVPDGSPAPSGCAARNNVFYKGKKGGGISIANPAAWTFSANCWPDGIPALAKDPASFKADPLFLKPETNAPDGFRLSAQSPCLGRAQPLKEVAADFWGTPRRKTTPCVGLHEPK